MNNTYTLKIGNLTRELPLIKINENLTIASFVILGDTELIEHVSPLLIKKLPPVDAIVTAEAKGIALSYEISKLLGLKKFYVARKSIKPYMDEPLIDEVISITTQKKQLLCFEKSDAEEIRNKNVALIDDVISSGESLLALERLVNKAGANIVAKASILAEGDAKNRDDIIFLESLPLF